MSKASGDIPRRRGGSSSSSNSYSNSNSKSKSYEDRQRGMDSGDTSRIATGSGSGSGALLLLSSSSAALASTKRISEAREDEAESSGISMAEIGNLATSGSKPNTIDASVLMLLDFGVEIALERAKRWSIVTKSMMLYVEKQASSVIEYARQVNKMLLGVKPIFLEQTHTPLQQAFLAAIDSDQEYNDLMLMSGASILRDKFMVPVTDTLNAYNKRRKQLKEIWFRQMKAMQDAINATEKAHSYYVTKRQQLERLREQQGSSASSVNEGNTKPSLTATVSSGGSAAVDAFTNFIGFNAASKADKKRKLEEEALHKLLDAEAAYKASVAAADRKHEEVLKLKLKVLQEIEAMMLEADSVLKHATLDYVHLRHEAAQTAPHRLEKVADFASRYEPGSEFTEFLRTMKPIDVSPPVHRRQNYNKEKEKDKDKEKDRSKRQSVVSSNRVSSMHSSDSQSSDLHYSNEQISTISVPTQEDISDSESIDTEFGYAQGDLDESPIEARKVNQLFAPKPKNPDICGSKNVVTGLFHRRKAIVGSEKTVAEDGAILECSRCGCQLTPISQTCGRCGASVLEDNRKTRRWFGVDLSMQVGGSEPGAKVPALLRMCLEDIEKENRGITMQGIYRISGVKSRVDRLAEEFEQCANAEDLRRIDLLEQQPHTVANLVKLYLRQLPEPLLTTSLFNEFVDVGKKYAADGNEQMAVSQLAQLAKRLPMHHYDSASLLFSHLKRISGQESTNQMSASNLGIVFAPSVLHHAVSDDRYNITDMQHQTKVVELLIKNVDIVFVPRKIARPPLLIPVINYETERRMSVGEATESSESLNIPQCIPRSTSDFCTNLCGITEFPEDKLRRKNAQRNRLQKLLAISPVSALTIDSKNSSSGNTVFAFDSNAIASESQMKSEQKPLEPDARLSMLKSKCVSTSSQLASLDYSCESINGFGHEKQIPSAPGTLPSRRRVKREIYKTQSLENLNIAASIHKAQSVTALNLVGMQSSSSLAKSKSSLLTRNDKDKKSRKEKNSDKGRESAPVTVADRMSAASLHPPSAIHSLFSKLRFSKSRRAMAKSIGMEAEYAVVRQRADESLLQVKPSPKQFYSLHRKPKPGRLATSEPRIVPPETSG